MGFQEKGRYRGTTESSSLGSFAAAVVRVFEQMICQANQEASVYYEAVDVFRRLLFVAAAGSLNGNAQSHSAIEALN